MSQALCPSATVSQAGRPSLTPANPSRTLISSYRPNLAHRVAKPLASRARHDSSPPLVFPPKRQDYSSDEDVKPELGAGQNAEVDLLSVSEMGDNTAADHESSNGGTENDGPVEEQMDALETEDDNSTSEDSMGDESVSSETSDDEDFGEASDDEEELAGDPVTTDAWSLHPSRKAILRLARLRDQQNDPFDVDIIPHTAQDVTIAALHSVRFLQSLGNDPVDPNRIGINRVGHPFLTGLSDEGNFRKDFSDMVANLERNAITIPKKEMVERTVKEYLKVGDKLDGIHDGVDQVHALLSAIKVVSESLRFEVIGLQLLQNYCSSVMREMNRVISAVTAVKQDLVDTGSTSLKRWNELRRMGGWSSMAASRGGNEISPDDIADVVRDFESYLKPYQRLLGMTVHLEDGLNEAIASLRDSSV